ncbi:hypothetical protein LRS13_02050 [Svornostia abyssi]|uniref:Uncharacterized protein n=1 Tax=Svornostia abyssi TaxID=2898438 RepID=A0ABY5PI99_9ACTN|nr:hypothetical protein LRS13_02050 [Parviterribacteraceae bacterium J379]
MLSPRLRRPACSPPGAAGCGSSDDTQTTANAGTPAAAAAGQGAPPQGGAPDLSTLASALGVTEAQLQSAMESTRPSDPSSGPPAQGDMAAELAEALGLDADKVQEALSATMPTPPTADATTS